MRHALVVNCRSNCNLNGEDGRGRSTRRRHALDCTHRIWRVQELELTLHIRRRHFVHVLAAMHELHSAPLNDFDGPDDGRVAALRRYDAEVVGHARAEGSDQEHGYVVADVAEHEQRVDGANDDAVVVQLAHDAVQHTTKLCAAAVLQHEQQLAAPNQARRHGDTVSQVLRVRERLQLQRVEKSQCFGQLPGTLPAELEDGSLSSCANCGVVAAL